LHTKIIASAGLGYHCAHTDYHLFLFHFSPFAFLLLFMSLCWFFDSFVYFTLWLQHRFAIEKKKKMKIKPKKDKEKKMEKAQSVALIYIGLAMLF